ncbi:serine/threonine-protein kinase [Nocardia fluminea]|uniref:Serine/threonine-protein kinase PknK n=1 Tax=Nocardia fluminea TaxID=134984 RepID=A0A2N3V9U8_9NOCA|nr:serine/threonine-protein kinase [Nocardia fluminea]PKV78394.1 serine/threonine-protein kinase PknK [Nocardia fluminea]
MDPEHTRMQRGPAEAAQVGLNTQRTVAPGVPDEAVIAELDAMGLTGAKEIGRGGFGVVYRALQPALDRVVAVKVLSSEIDVESRERFLREEQAMGRLSGHPNIVDILQVDVTETGLPLIVMPYCSRGSLERLIHDRGPLTWSDTLRAGVKLAAAIESAHRAGILHRDVKPANVLISGYGEPQLTDFGIARIPGGFQTSSSLITGSPAFTAPEVLKGSEPTVRSDVYGLGATLFALLTGHAAFERQAGEKVVAQFLRITTQHVPDLRAQDIPGDVAAVIERAMSPEPEDRPASAYEFGELLREVQRAHGQMPDEMALLNSEETTDDTPETLKSVTGRRSWPLTLQPAGASVPMSGSTTGTFPPTAATKFRPPTPAREPFPRQRLLDVLREGGARRLALIHAPAGFGKSTIATQWRGYLTTRDIPVAWLGVDQDDDSEIWFLAHLIQAIRRVRPDVGAGLEQVLEERPADAVAYVIATLIDEIHASGRPVVVVVDDWHRVRDPGVQRAMATLLDNGCHHVRFVITSRDQSGLPISRLRVRDELVELDAAALRLTESETRQILVERNGFVLTDEQIEQIHVATDGWPAAIQLVSLTLRGKADPTQLLASLAEGGHGMREYLAENVLDALAPEQLEFLMAISVVERVNGSLAGLLADVPDGAAMLEQAEQRELFLHRIQHDPEWYRMQPLFAEHLRARLDREHPGRSKVLHRRAARWYAEHQLLRKSVDHALAATDLKLAADLLESGGMDLIDGSRLGTLLGSVSKLPVQQVTSRSKLLMAVARANMNMQQTGTARSALGRLSNLLARSAPGEPELTEQRCVATVLDAADRVAHDDIAEVADSLAPILAEPGDLPAWTVSTAANLMSFVRLCEFDFDAVTGLQDWAADYHTQSKDPLGPVFGLCALGDAAYEQLEIGAATTSFEQAYEAARTMAGPRSDAARIAAALLGEVAYRRGDLALADRLLDESHQLVTRVGPVDFLIATFVIGARVKAALGDQYTASARLDEGSRVAGENGLARLDAHVRAERSRLGFPAGEDTFVPDSSGNGARRKKGAAALITEARAIADIRVLLAEQRLRADDRAARHARVIYAKTLEQRRPRAELDATLLLAECLASAGWVGEATGLVLPVLRTCAELGWTRPLLDAGPGVVGLLHVLRTQSHDGHDHPILRELPGHFLDELLA